MWPGCARDAERSPDAAGKIGPNGESARERERLDRAGSGVRTARGGDRGLGEASCGCSGEA
jgi:hypothetical protein